MAKRKKKYSAPMRTTSKVKRIKRRRSGRKRGLLSEMFTPGQFQESGRATLSGGLGGFASVGVDLALPNQTPTIQALTKLGIGFLFCSMKMPYMGAGMAGAAGAQFAQGMFGLSEDNANYADPIETLPMFLNENGQPELLADNTLLAEIVNYAGTIGNQDMNSGVYPSYVPADLVYNN